MSKQIYNKATEYIKRGWVVHKLYPPKDGRIKKVLALNNFKNGS